MQSGACGSDCGCHGAEGAPSDPQGAEYLTDEDGLRALREHAVERATLARSKVGGEVDWCALLTLLDDSEVVRYPTRVAFDASALQAGEFAHAQPAGEDPKAGYTLFIHPQLRDRTDLLPLVAAYHLVTVNYGDMATAEAAEHFGATLLGLQIDDYYLRLCAIADGLERD